VGQPVEGAGGEARDALRSLGRRTDPSRAPSRFSREGRKGGGRARGGDDAHHLRHCRGRFVGRVAPGYAVTVGAREQVRASCLGATFFSGW